MKLLPDFGIWMHRDYGTDPFTVTFFGVSQIQWSNDPVTAVMFIQGSMILDNPRKISTEGLQQHMVTIELPKRDPSLAKKLVRHISDGNPVELFARQDRMYRTNAPTYETVIPLEPTQAFLETLQASGLELDPKGFTTVSPQQLAKRQKRLKNHRKTTKR